MEKLISSNPNKNKFGLSRNIPATVKLEVRERCGFGCVVCGSAIYEYDHFSPEFWEAEKHDPHGIALLCGSCHSRKTKGLLAPEEYQQHIKHPHALNEGKATFSWKSSNACPEIVLGPFVLDGECSLLSIEGETILGFSKPESTEAPPNLLLKFFDRESQESLVIFHNEVLVNHGAFDISSRGREWTVRSSVGRIDLSLRFDPPTRITIERMYLRLGKWVARLTSNHFSVGTVDHPDTISLSYEGNAWPEATTRIKGDCFFELSTTGDGRNNFGSSKSHSHMDMGGEPPCPIGTIPLGEGQFRVTEPVYLLHDKSTGEPIFLGTNWLLYPAEQINSAPSLIEGSMPVFTRKEFANHWCGDEIEAKPVGIQQARTLAWIAWRKYRMRYLLFNPGATRSKTCRDIREFAVQV